MVLFNKQTVLLEYILLAMNVLLEYLKILYPYRDIKIYINVNQIYRGSTKQN